MNTKLLFVASLAVLSSSVIAGGITEVSNFEKLDLNEDGVINSLEASKDPTLVKQWKNLDTNSNGRLETAEFSAFESALTYVPPVDDDEPAFGAAPY